MLYFINEVLFLYVYTRMAFKDLLVNYAKTQTCLAVTAMKVSVRSVTTLHCWWKPHAVSSFLCFNLIEICLSMREN